MERLYFDRPDVYALADYDDARLGGQVRYVVCEHPDGTSYAAQLAAGLGVPLHLWPDSGDQADAGRPAPARHQSAPPSPHERTATVTLDGELGYATAPALAAAQAVAPGISPGGEARFPGQQLPGVTAVPPLAGNDAVPGPAVARRLFAS